MKCFKKLLVLTFATLALETSQAAPFCVVKSYGKDCYYHTRSSCERAAGRDGMCVANSDDEERGSRSPSSGFGAPFCVITPYGKECRYYSASECRRAAERSDGACVPNR